MVVHVDAIKRRGKAIRVAFAAHFAVGDDVEPGALLLGDGHDRGVVPGLLEPLLGHTPQFLNAGPRGESAGQLLAVDQPAQAGRRIRRGSWGCARPPRRGVSHRLFANLSHTSHPRYTHRPAGLFIAPLKAKGDLAEVMIAADLVRRGYKIAIPYGEDWDFDLIVCRDERLERVQCKYTTLERHLHHRPLPLAFADKWQGKATKHYTGGDDRLDGRLRPRPRIAATTSPLASSATASGDCGYGWQPPLNNQRQVRVRISRDDYHRDLMEPAGLEPAASVGASDDALPTELWPRRPGF